MPDPAWVHRSWVLKLFLPSLRGAFPHKYEQRLLGTDLLVMVCLTVPVVSLRRCKLFYKKDDEFKEKGVGTLHLKPTANQKTQLLVRADTNLGGCSFSQVAPRRQSRGSM